MHLLNVPQCSQAPIVYSQTGQETAKTLWSGSIRVLRHASKGPALAIRKKSYSGMPEPWMSTHNGSMSLEKCGWHGFVHCWHHVPGTMNCFLVNSIVLLLSCTPCLPQVCMNRSDETERSISVVRFKGSAHSGRVREIGRPPKRYAVPSSSDCSLRCIGNYCLSSLTE